MPENPTLRLLMAAIDVNGGYRNVRVFANKAHHFCYTVGGVVVTDFKLRTFD